MSTTKAKKNAKHDGQAAAVAAATGTVVSMPQSAAAPSPFTPIADYAFLSDCHTGALVAPDGTIDWLCIPRFDSPSVFGSLLDRGAGAFRLGPFGINVPSNRDYEPGTNTLVTTWKTPSGWADGSRRPDDGSAPRRGHDHSAHAPAHRRGRRPRPGSHREVHRRQRRGRTRVRAGIQLRPRATPSGRCRRTATARTPPAPVRSMRLQTDMLLGVEANHVRARHVLHEGEELFVALSWDNDAQVPTTVEEANAQLKATTRFWRRWLSKARIPDHEFRALIQRSALAIKGLTYMPTGATVAALTTSLPETPGGERNWDYRYTWIRDSTFTLQALHYLDLDWEADEFMQFIADLERNDDGGLQIMYGIDGRRDLTEELLKDLSGYDGASPVRTGNGAFDQRQNDVFGAALDSVLLHTRRSQRLPRRLWPLIQAQAECAKSVWKQPDQGIWEARGKPQHYVSSKLMCWVAMDRAGKLADIRGENKLAANWRAVADEIKADILEHGVDKRGVLVQHYDTESLDASTLLAAIFGFLPGEDERMRASVLAIADELTEHGFVLRYRTDETDDGLSGKEGTFVICSFWLVSALAIIGEMQRARDLMTRLTKVASPLLLYAEEFDVDTGRHLGNFPQAFSHLALVEAAGRIILAERIEELGA